MRGALRTSRTRGGMRWTQKARETHAPDAYGEVAWFGRRGAGAKLAIRSAGDGGKRAVLREEREVSRKATAQGRPGCSRRTCMLVCAFAMCTGTRDRGCGKHPVFPAPSIQEEGNETFKPRVKRAARSRKHAHVIASASMQSMSPLAARWIASLSPDCISDNFLFSVAATNTPSLFCARPQDVWCGSRHTLSVLSVFLLAKEPHCSQTCRKCVWNFHGNN